MGPVCEDPSSADPLGRLRFAEEDQRNGGRLDIDDYYVQLLPLVAARSTCRRRAVAAIITDVQGRVLSTGYNGVSSGIVHCIDKACPGADDKSGDSSRCEAVHAEQNAIIQCADLSRAHNMYCSCSPCFTCAKMILNTPIKNVIYVEEYADKAGLEILNRLINTWQQA